MKATAEQKLRKIFSQRLQIERRKASLTQEQLAERVGKSVDLISRLERTTTGPSLQTIALIAEALKIPAASLLAHTTVAEPSAKKQLDEIIDLVLFYTS